MNRDIFFASVRRNPFNGSMTQSQVDGIDHVLDEWEIRRLTDFRWLGYMLATDYHETAHTMQPIREMGGEAYLKSKPYYPWVGEGLVQVTWEANAKKFGATKPGDLMTWPLALRALFDGMINGMFTGKKLADYFNDRTTDWVNARRIVNGTDKASEIASYGQAFHGALQAAVTGDVSIPAPVKPTQKPAQPVPMPPLAPLPPRPPAAPPLPLTPPAHQQLGIGAVVLLALAGVGSLWPGLAGFWPWLLGGAIVLGVLAMFFWNRAKK